MNNLSKFKMGLLLSVAISEVIHADVKVEWPEGEGSATIEEVMVTGTRASQLRAIERKRGAKSIMDAISSDDVGKLPDYNAADALQRLPGLSVQIDQGEGRYPVVRGIDSNLSNVTIDGNVVATPEADGRRVALDIIPSDLIAAIEVTKAITPDLDGNAVGGNVNVVTHSAFDKPEGFLYGTLQAGYNDQSGENPYGGSVVYGTTFGESDSFGVVFAASYYDRQFNTQLREGLSWNEFETGGVSAHAPELFKIFDYNIDRERWGVNLNLESRPNDNLKLYLNTFFNEFTDIETRHQIDFDIARGDATVNSPTSVSFTEGRAKLEVRQNNQIQQLLNITPGFEYSNDVITWSGNYAFAHAEEVTPLRRDFEYRSGSETNLATTFTNTGGDFIVEGAPGLDDQSNFAFRRYLTRVEATNEDVDTIRTDLSYIIDDGTAWTLTLQGGLKFRQREKTSDAERQTIEPINDFTFADTGLAIPGPDIFDGRYNLGPIVDYKAHEAYYLANIGNFEVDEEDSLIDSRAADYTVDEEITSAYFMTTYETEKLQLIGGVRVEKTESDYTAFGIVDANGDGVITESDISTLTGSNDYTNVLPSLHLKYSLSDDLSIRAAWTNTIGRPNYADLVPRFEDDDGEAEAGNPELEPFESMGLDLSIEYYFQETGVLSLGVFYKDIKNPIFSRVTTNVTYQGVAVDELVRPENSDSGTLLGLEANWQQDLTFLPEIFEGLGISANLTAVSSEGDVIGREDEDLPFLRQSDLLYNVALYYVKGEFEARIATTYQTEFIDAYGSSADDDFYFDERSQWDFKASYGLNDNMTIFTHVKNFAEDSRKEFSGRSSRLQAEEAYGWTALVGVSANF